MKMVKSIVASVFVFGMFGIVTALPLLAQGAGRRRQPCRLRPDWARK